MTRTRWYTGVLIVGVIVIGACVATGRYVIAVPWLFITAAAVAELRAAT